MAQQLLLGLFSRGWRSVRSAGPRRLAVTGFLLLTAVLLARLSWSIPMTDEAERALYDLRSYTMAPLVEQDDRILLVVYNDRTLIKARKRSPLDRGLLAKALRNLDTMGAKAIGIDILFDQPQDEDDDLVATLRGMQTPSRIAYAELATNKDDIIFEQQEFLKSFLARLEGSKAAPASILLDNTAGVTRIWPPEYPDLPPVLGRAMLDAAGEHARTLPGYHGAIRYRLPSDKTAPALSYLPIDSFLDPEIAPLLAPVVKDRYVLIGGQLVDFDRVETPFTAITQETVPGIQVHAEMIAQMLDGNALRQLSDWYLWAQAILVVVAATFSGLLEMRSWRVIPLLIIQAVMFAGLPVFLQSRGFDTYLFPSVGPILGWVLAFAAIVTAARASGAVQRRFAHSALGKYLPRSIAQEIIDKPELLALHGEKKEIFVLFSDLEGFTKMSHAIEPEMVAKLLNRYLEMLSQVVLEHGGVIDKFVGDAVVAFWGAPIALPDDGERAARAGYALWQAGETFRESVDPDLPPVGRTRVGLHFGEAVVGNFGGESRIQYTALGDSMNTAARLEAANKALETRALASREFVERSDLKWWRPMGRIVLRGRKKPVDVFEPAPEFSEDDRHKLFAAMDMVAEDREAALQLLSFLVQRNPADIALKNLLQRTQSLNEEGAYVLG